MEDLIGYLVVFFVVIMAIAAAVAAVFSVGAIYGVYRALVCYATSLKRTYGSDATYEPQAGMYVLCAFVLLILAVFAFFVFAATGLL